MYHRHRTWCQLARLLAVTLVAGRTTAFVPSISTKSFLPRLFASDGPPQYDKIDMVLLESKPVGEGSQLLTMAPKDESTTLDYQAGHVLALEIEAPETLTNEKTKQDAANNDGWMRGPYTVTRCPSPQEMEILVKVVGEKTQAMADASSGAPLKIGGKFKVPIMEGIIQVAAKGDGDERQPTRRVVLISTGVGVGPCMGAVEEWLQQDESSSLPSSVSKIDLVASFRTEAEIVSPSRLDELSEKSDGLFSWQPVITSRNGRVSDSVENLQTYITAANAATASCSISETHYHLIGNGQLVQEWQEGLAQAGVPTERVTTEMYFNHRGETDSDRISRIAKAIEKAATAIPVAVDV